MKTVDRGEMHPYKSWSSDTAILLAPEWAANYGDAPLSILGKKLIFLLVYQIYRHMNSKITLEN